jgi:hypothetical protein
MRRFRKSHSSLTSRSPPGFPLMNYDISFLGDVQESGDCLTKASLRLAYHGTK